MSLKDALITELKHESSLTKKMLERIPLDKKEWKPHERSMTVGRLATHVAELPQWITDITTADEFDFKARPFRSYTASSTEELLTIFQDNLDRAMGALDQTTDEEFNKIWVVRNGEQVIFRLPKKVAVRGWGFSHMIHHRGQLSVYLRLLDVPVPGMYGPTADESFG